jgi:hypothetical protein
MATTSGLGDMPGMMDEMNSQPPNPASQVAETNPQNPSQASPDDGLMSMNGVSEEESRKLVDIISEYRSSWAQDRLERIRQWMENLFYWRGIQVIRWDTATNCWYDALAWSRSQAQESGEDTDLERWINPLTLMFCNVFTGTMSRTLPKPIVKPRNADPDLKDNITAKASIEALRIIGRQNEAAKMNRSIYEMLYLFGCYFRYTRPAIDGELFGYDEVPVFEDMEIQTGPQYVCPKCGTQVPATSPGGMECPGCGAFLGQESYYGDGEGNRMSLKMTGTKKVPRAGVKQTIGSPLEWDVDPKAKGDHPMRMTPIASYDVEIDFGEACQMFPKFRDQIQPGAESSTTPNASVEKLSRLDAVSAMGGMTADNSMANPTFSRNWMTTRSFYKKRDWAFAAKMEKQFPDGLLLSMVGEVVVDIRPASLTKEVSHAALYANQGVYCNALANTAVSFNARFNRAMWILDDWASRASTGHNFVDSSRVDTEKMSGKQIPAGTLTGLPKRVNGEPWLSIQDVFAHFDMPVNPALWNYPQMLMTFCELILGIPRQIAGQGTQEDVETLGGQQLQLSRAMTVLKPYFENVKSEDATASQNAIEALQALMRVGAVTEIMDVVEARGGAFENKNVDWNAMQGNVRVVEDEDQDLPVSPEELRAAIQTMFDGLTKGNPAATEWFNVPENQDLALSTMLPGSVLPDEAQQLKTESDIQLIIEQGPQVTMRPNGSVGSELAAHPSTKENFPVAKKVLQQFILSHFELRVTDPQAWMALHQYGDELEDMEMQVAQKRSARQLSVTQAGQPKPPAPDPQIQGEMQQLIAAAQIAIQRLTQIAQLDPMLTGGAKDQVSAAKEVVDSTVDAAKLMAGGK